MTTIYDRFFLSTKPTYIETEQLKEEHCTAALVQPRGRRGQLMILVLLYLLFRFLLKRPLLKP